MRSGWFFGTEMWAAYLIEYSKTRPECLHEWRSSPLAPLSHDFIDLHHHYERTEHFSQVIDLGRHKRSEMRKGHKSDIKNATALYDTWEFWDVAKFKEIHRRRFGLVRNDATFAIQDEWVKSGKHLLWQPVTERMNG